LLTLPKEGKGRLALLGRRIVNPPERRKRKIDFPWHGRRITADFSSEKFKCPVIIHTLI